MALAPCRECGARVSTEAASYPQCGVPQRTRRMGGGTEATRAQAADAMSASFASPETLTTHEDPIYRARIHWSIYSHTLLMLILAGVAVPVSDVLAIGLAGLALIFAVVAYIRSTSTEF